MIKDILERLVSFDTVADRQNKELMDFAEEFFTSRGFCVERKHSEETGKDNLIASFGEDPQLGFLGHTDVISIAEGWETDPFTMIEKDGYYYGLGTCDMKGGIACFMEAIDRTDLSKLKKGLKVYLTYDEEILFKGIGDLVRAGTEFPPHMLVAEPTDMIPSTGSKGLIEVRMNFYGETTHSSVPIEGKNSNKNAAVFVNRMLEFEKELKLEKYEFFGVPITTMNVGVIRGGCTSNQVPSHTYVMLDFRVCDSEGQYQRIRQAIDRALEEFDADYEFSIDIPSFISEGGLGKTLEELSGNKAKPFSGVSEASFMTVDRAIFGPGPMTMHEKNEHVSIESLDKTEKIYEELIQIFCGG